MGKARKDRRAAARLDGRVEIRVRESFDATIDPACLDRIMSHGDDPGAGGMPKAPFVPLPPAGKSFGVFQTRRYINQADLQE